MFPVAKYCAMPQVQTVTTWSALHKDLISLHVLFFIYMKYDELLLVILSNNNTDVTAFTDVANGMIQTVGYQLKGT